MKSSVTLSENFSSAHFYHQPVWSREKNQIEFGRCFTEHGHGHNYKVEATFADLPATALPRVRSALKAVVSEFDHEHLNFIIPEFKAPAPGVPALVPTTENIAQLLWERLRAVTDGAVLIKLRLFEMEDLWVEVLP